MSIACVYLVDGKAARERRWPPSWYARPRNVRVLTLHDPTTVGLWESFILLISKVRVTLVGYTVRYYYYYYNYYTFRKLSKQSSLSYVVFRSCRLLLSRATWWRCWHSVFRLVLSSTVVTQRPWSYLYLFTCSPSWLTSLSIHLQSIWLSLTVFLICTSITLERITWHASNDADKWLIYHMVVF